MKHITTFSTRLLLIVVIALLTMSATLLGNQYKSVTSGNWSSYATWQISTDGGSTWNAAATIPGRLSFGGSITDTVLIQDTYTVTIDTGFDVNTLTIGQGTSGVLTFATIGKAQRDTVNGPVTINAGGQFLARPAPTATADTMFFGGDLTNNGTLDFCQGVTGNTGNGICATVFNNIVGDQHLQTTGSPVITRFWKVYLVKAVRANRVLATIPVNIGRGTYANGTGSLFMNAFRGNTNPPTGSAGTWEQNAGRLYNSKTFSVSNLIAYGNFQMGLAFTGSGGYIDSTGSSYFGVPTTFNTSDSIFNSSGVGSLAIEDTATLNAGTLVGYGTAFAINSYTTVTPTVVFTMNGGAVVAHSQGGSEGNNAAGYNVFQVQATCKFVMNGGTITIVDPNVAAGAGREIWIYSGVNAGTSFSGGTIYLGDGVTSLQGNQGFRIYDPANIPLNNLVVQGGGGGGGRRGILLSNVSVNGTLTVASNSVLDDSTYTLTALGPVVNSGSVTDNTGGEVKLLSGGGPNYLSGGGSYTNLELDAINGAVLSGASTVAGTLTLTAGTFNVGTGTLTLQNPLGGTPANLVGGSSASIVIGGTVAGINLPSSVSELSNFTLNNSHGSTLQGALQVDGSATITNGVLTTGANTLTLGSSGSLSEAGNGNIVLGTVQSTRTVSGITPRAKGLKAPLAYETFGNIGFDIDPAGGTSPGLTTVTRTTGTAQGFASRSILRYYDVNATTNSGLTANVVFHFDSAAAELNGYDRALSLWRSSNGGADWSSVGGTVDSTHGTVSKTGVTNLSRWTASQLPLVSSNSILSDIIAGSLTIPSTISSIATTQGAEVAVFSFEVRDGGATGDPDAVPTIINNLTIEQGSANAAADWTQYIQGANLFDGASDLGAATVHTTSLTFSGSPIVSVPDDGNKTLTLKIYLKASLPAGSDNKVLEFKINGSSDIVIDGSGSGMAPGASDVVGTPGTSIAVVATNLSFVGSIGHTSTGWTFSTSVSATDIGGNISAEYTSGVTLAIASGAGVLSGTIPKPAVLGVASFTDLSIVGHGPFTLSAASGVLTGAVSSVFTVDSSALFKVAAGGPNDTLYWDVPSTWNVLTGYSYAHVPHSLDHVFLDNTYQTGSYTIKIGVDTAGGNVVQVTDTAATINIGYPHNPNTITLLIPTAQNLYYPGAFYWGDALPGNYDMVIDTGGLFQNSSTCGAHNAFNYPAILPNGGTVSVDSLLIKKGGKYLHNSTSYGSGIFGMSHKLDGDYGTVEYDVPSAFSDVNGQNYWYPNLVFSNTHGAPVYYVYSSSNGAMYVKGDLITNPGAKDSLGLTPDQPTMVYGNVINNGTCKFNGGPLMWAGSTAQTVSGNPISLNAGAVVMNNAGVNLQSNLNVTGGTVQATGSYTYVIVLPGTTTAGDSTVTVGGVINTGADTLFLTPAGGLSEGTYPVQGNVTSTRVLVQSHNTDFGNGFQMDALGGVPGSTTVFRKTGVADSGYAHNKSILRHYDVTAANNTALNATIAVGYAPTVTELNGISQSNLLLQKSADYGTTWAGKKGTIDSTTNYLITATGVNSPNARWTMAAATAPLFVPHAIVIRSFKDTVGTVAPQVAQKWRLALYQDSVTASTLLNSGFLNSGILGTTYLASGTYILAENDSSGWIHLGRIHHGTSIGHSVISSSLRFDTLIVTDASPNSADTVDFINQQVSSITVVKLRDFDGRLSTTGDQQAQSWHLSLYKGSVAPANLVDSVNNSVLFVTSLAGGSYIAVEADSGAPWYRLNGNHTRYDTLALAANQSVADTFINLKANALSVQKYQDKDGKFATVADRVLKNWYLAVHRDSANGTLVTSGSATGISAGNLGNGTYYVSEADSAGWLNLGYVVNGVSTASATDNISVSLMNGQVDSIAFVNAPPLYSQTFRTFRPDSIANLGLPTKAVVPTVPSNVQFTVTVVNESTNVGNFHMEFGDPVIDSSIRPFTITPPATKSMVSGSKGAKWDFYFVSPIGPGTPVTVSGWATTTKALQKVSKYRWMRGQTKLGKTDLTVAATGFTVNQLHAPMPNMINVLSQAYNDVFNVGNTKTGGMRIGVEVDSLKADMAWVTMKGYANLTASLYVKPYLQTGTPRGLDFKAPEGVISDTTKASDWLKGGLTSLSPKAAQSNALFGNLVALKLSIGASYDSITPVGLGELVYDDGTLNPLNGMHVKDIALKADTLMSGYVTYAWDTTWTTKHLLKALKLVRIRNFADYGTYLNLSNTIYSIDTAFQGPMDTLSFSTGLAVKGTHRLVDVAYLRADPNMLPSKNTGPRALVTAEYVTPVAYTLYQNYPNPFNPTTTIRFDLPQQAVVTLKIYNILGQEVATLFDRQQMDNGTQEVQFNASRFASGVYFYRMIAEGMSDDGMKTSTYVTVKKMLLLK